MGVVVKKKRKKKISKGGHEGIILTGREYMDKIFNWRNTSSRFIETGHNKGRGNWAEQRGGGRAQSIA